MTNSSVGYLFSLPIIQSDFLLLMQIADRPQQLA